jgi:hypothetical protein
MVALQRVSAAFVLLLSVAFGFSPAVGAAVARAADLADIEAEVAEAKGSIQLFNMAVWDSPGAHQGVFVSFTPVSGGRSADTVNFRTELVDGEQIEVADIAPELDESDVRIEIDDAPVDIVSMHWYYAGYGDLGGADTKYMPVCVIRAGRPELSDGEHALRVMIEDADAGAHGESVVAFESSVPEL